MPEWLIILLVFLALGVAFYGTYRWGHNRGYDAGTEDAQRINAWSDDIMRKYRG